MSRSAPVIASAASTVAPPANAAKRAKHPCSCASSSSWLQSIVACRVRWRAGASRAPEASAVSSRSRISAGDSSPQRAAASSSASGKPSTRRQISATASALPSPRAKSGWRARARSLNSATAATSASASSSCDVRGSGSASGETGNRSSACSDSGSRLVASTVTRGTGPKQLADERRRVEQVLEVVSDQQQVLGGEEALDRLLGRLAGERDDPERLHDCDGDVLGAVAGRPARRGARRLGNQPRRREPPRARGVSCRRHRAPSASAGARTASAAAR